MITLLDLTYDSGQYVVFCDKIWPRVLDLWLDVSFGPKLPKTSFYACPRLQMLDTAFRSNNFFVLRFINYAKNKLLFSNFGWFLAKVWVFIARKLQNKPTKDFMVPLQICIFPIAKSCLKNPFFGTLKSWPNLKSEHILKFSHVYGISYDLEISHFWKHFSFCLTSLKSFALSRNSRVFFNKVCP